MTCGELITAALQFAGETEAPDYEARAPLMLGTILLELHPAVSLWGAAHGADIPTPAEIPFPAEEEDLFPYDAVWAPVCIYTLAGCLSSFEDAAASEEALAKAEGLKAILLKHLPAKVEKIG